MPSSNTGDGNMHFVHYNFIGAFSATFNYRNSRKSIVEDTGSIHSY